MKRMYKCKLCTKEFSERGIKKHIKNSHKDVMTFEQYYDKYLKRPNEGFCQNPNCTYDNGKPIKTTLRGIAGYDKYCCIECANEDNPMHNPEIVRKVSDKLKANFKDPIKRENTIAKQKATKKRLYDDENFNDRDKAKATCLTKYGEEYYSQTEGCKKRIKNTSIENWGVSHHLKAKPIKEKRIKTNLDRYGVENVTQVSEFKRKMQKTKDLKRGEINENISKSLKEAYGERGDEINEKRRLTNIKRTNKPYAMQRDSAKKKSKETTMKAYLRKCIKYLAELDIEFVNPEIFIKCEDKVELRCLKHDLVYTNSIYNLRVGHGRCPKCQSENKKNSIPEQEILEFIKELGLDSYKDNSTVKNPISGKFLELDVFIPGKKFAIEHNGIYYHSEDFKDKNYHAMKLEACKRENITLFQIFEDEWYDENKKEILKNMIKHKLGCDNSKRIHGRDCTIQELKYADSKDFLDKYHILGGSLKEPLRLGAFYNNELVAVMTFGHGNLSRGNIGDKLFWELSRFCTNFNYKIPGIASKLLSYFKNNYGWNTIVSFADKRLSDGGLYETLGFRKHDEVNPTYYYVDYTHKKRFNRFDLRKKPDEPKDIPEWVLRTKEGYKRIWDCGKIKFIMENI